MSCAAVAAKRARPHSVCPFTTTLPQPFLYLSLSLSLSLSLNTRHPGPHPSPPLGASRLLIRFRICSRNRSRSPPAATALTLASSLARVFLSVSTHHSRLSIRCTIRILYHCLACLGLITILPCLALPSRTALHHCGKGTSQHEACHCHCCPADSTICERRSRVPSVPPLAPVHVYVHHHLLDYPSSTFMRRACVYSSFMMGVLRAKRDAAQRR